MSTYHSPRMTSRWPIERLPEPTRRRDRRIRSALAIVAGARPHPLTRPNPKDN